MYNGRQPTQQSCGPRTFFNSVEQEPNDGYSENPGVHASSGLTDILLLLVTLFYIPQDW